MSVRIVTDSTADFPGSRPPGDVTVLPLRVHFGAEELRDRVDCTDEEFVQRLIASPEFPRTSVPPPGEFADAYRRLLRDPEDAVVSIHIAEALSGTCQSARTAAQMVDPHRIHVVDSRTVTMGLGFLVLDALEAAGRGQSAARIAAAIPERRSRTGVVCLLDTLRYLEKGGRFGRIQALLGGILSIKQLAAIGRDGVMEPIGRARSRGGGRARLLEVVRARGPITRLGVIHVASPEAAAGLRDELAREHPGLAIGIGHASPVIASHAGPGALGVGFVGSPEGG